MYKLFTDKIENFEARIKLEGASRIPWDNSIYGVKAQKKEYDRLKIKQALSKIEMLEKDFRESEVWPYYKTILNFGKAEERAKLFKDSSRKDLVSMLSTAIKDLCLVCEQPLSELK